ncbi:MAG: Phosphoglucosamine mutase [Pseudomonadales bacterium]|nr:Phosphoglucosamine mutase [Pseudomonadales bacterium]
MSRRFFGTDGIRGKVGVEPITPDFVLKLGWAAGRVLARHGSGSRTSNLVLIGKDTRISGYMFESALEAGLVAAGLDVSLLGPMPTPAVAYLTRTFRAAAGIVISASHNPFDDNGIKFFSSRGTKLPDAIEHEIEDELERPMQTRDSRGLGKVTRLGDAAGRYIEYCKGTFPADATLDGLKLVVDCAHGATYHVAPAVFEELGASVVALGVSPDGFNINRDAGSTSPRALSAAVLANGADMGIALDGDGDRLICVDHTGAVVDGDELLYIIAAEQQRVSGQCAGVVGTLMSNLGMEVALRELGIPFARAKVGDRYVLELMDEKGWRLGGESSGHIICRDVTTTGDGIVSALRVLAAMSARGESLHALRSRVTKFPQTMINVRMERQADLAGNGAVGAAVRAVEGELGERGRVLLRASGTEPVIRVMVEGRDAAEVERHARALADVVRSAAG